MSVAALEMAPVEMVAVSLIDLDGKNLRREKGDVSGLKASLASLADHLERR